MVLSDVVLLIRGKPGSKVRLTIRKPDGIVREITVIRDVVIIEEGFAKSMLIETSQKEIVGLINLPRFYADFNNGDGRFCADDVAKEIEKLKNEGVKGIILDLRGNGGGSLRDVVKMSGLFIEQGPIVQVKSRERKPEVLSDNDNSVLYNGPLIIMVNQFSASASEILAAALQDYGRAVIVGVGGSTFGKGTVQRFFDLDAVIRGNADVKPLGEVKLTVQKFFRVNGGSTQLKGVIPDIILPDGWMFHEIGEKQEDFPMQWSQIEPVAYEQKVYNLKNLKKIQSMSAERVKKNSQFAKVYERAGLLKKQRDETKLPLSLENYRSYNAKIEAENKQFDNIFSLEIVNGVRNLNADLPSIEKDESKKSRNTDWIKNLKKDIYLMESLNIMHDMIAAKS
jgi:carboxyl-terminal processing protease